MSSSWFNKRKERNFIPPVESENSRSTSELSSSGTADTLVASSDRYQRNRAVDIYTRGQGNLETDRKELFSGYNPEKVSTGRFAHDGPTLPDPTGEENEEDVEGIKQQTRFMKQESVNSTRNALRMAREAEETARNTVGKLGNQSGTQRVVCCGFSPHTYHETHCREAC
jgi:protein transport protein SEC9